MDTLFIIVAIAAATTAGVFLYRMMRRGQAEIKASGGPTNPPIIYGAWQGHNLGTTTMEPDDLPHIEEELRKAGEKREE